MLWLLIKGAEGANSAFERASAGRSLIFVRPMKIKLILKWITRAILVGLILAFLVGFVAYWRSTNDCDRRWLL